MPPAITLARTEADIARCFPVRQHSGVQRREAHRFYFRERLHISPYHFTLALQ